MHRLAALASLTLFAPWFQPVFSADSSSGTTPLACTVSWVGNSFGAPDKWVQMAAETMVTAPDGTCYTNVSWEEGGGNVTVYRDGDVLGTAGHTHGWGYEGGAAVAANDAYVFIAQQVSNEGGGLKEVDSWPAKGKTWYGVSRRKRDARTPAPFEGGKGGSGDTLKGCFLVVNEVDEHAEGSIRGLWADAKRVYVATPTTNTITLYDSASMVKVGSWSVERPRQLVGGADGSLWVIQGGNGAPGSAIITHLGSEGQPLPGRITGIAEPTALAIDAKGRLLVADNGPDQQVKIFADLDRTPTQVGTLGRKGGILAAPRGEFGAQKFNGLVGVGADRLGNTYVCSSATGLVLESYAPTGALNWSLHGLEFVDCGDFDPKSERDVYTKEEHLVLDYDKPAGKEWRYQGCTLDRLAYPDDPRCGHAEFASTWARRIQGRLVVFGIDMYANHLLIYRASGKDEILAPCGMMVKGHFAKAESRRAWPPNQPEKGEWIWHDADGNGAFDAGEFESATGNAPGMEWGWWVDEAGNVWQAGKGGVRRIPFQGFDANGTPLWSLAKAELKPMPAPFTGIERVIRDAKQDTLILSGWSADFPNAKGNWKTPGKVIARCDHWSGQPTSRWEIHPPFDEAAEHSKTGGTTVSLAIAGDYLFVAYLISAEIRVYRLDDGAYAGSLLPPKNLSGWIDLPYGINATKRANGEYLVLAEEDAKAKNLLYRWKPVASGAPSFHR